MPKVKYVCACSLVCVCFQGDLNWRTYFKKIIQYNVSLQNRKFQNVRYISQDCVCVCVWVCMCVYVGGWVPRQRWEWRAPALGATKTVDWQAAWTWMCLCKPLSIKFLYSHHLSSFVLPLHLSLLPAPLFPVPIIFYPLTLLTTSLLPLGLLCWEYINDPHGN